MKVGGFLQPSGAIGTWQWDVSSMFHRPLATSRRKREKGRVAECPGEDKPHAQDPRPWHQMASALCRCTPELPPTAAGWVAHHPRCLDNMAITTTCVAFNSLKVLCDPRVAVCATATATASAQGGSGGCSGRYAAAAANTGTGMLCST